MVKKFAYVEYAENRKSIPIKFNILKKSDILFEWYVKKYNPILINDIEIMNAEGYSVIIPIEKKEEENKEKINNIIERTLEMLINENISIVRFPFDNMNFESEIQIANGINLFPLFIYDTIKEVLKQTGKKIESAEILIIDGDTDKTEFVVDCIYNEFNYLSIMTSEEKINYFKNKAFDIFDENGLEVHIFSKNKFLVENADIIINTSSQDCKLDYIFKRNSVYIDLSLNSNKFNEIVRKRDDMVFIDGFKLKYKNQIYDMKQAELAVFILCDDYRNILKKGYESKKGFNTIDFINSYGIKFSCACQKNIILTSSYYIKRTVKNIVDIAY